MLVGDFSIAFCFARDKVLLIRRTRSPFVGFWNGLGGKCEPGESMESCVVREVAEESGLPLVALRRPEHLGWVGWKDRSSATHAGAMAAYCFRLDETYVWEGSRSTPEGDVAWVPTQVLSGTSSDVPVVPNIALFLPPMLQSEHPSHFMCSYDDDRLVSVDPWAGGPVDASPSGDREMIT